METKDRLIAIGLISKVFGELTWQNPRLAMIVQARSMPKKPFEAFIALAASLSAEPLSVYVDNLYSQIFFKRSVEQQSVIDKEYLNFFRERKCKVYFSTEMRHNTHESPISYLIKQAERIPVKEFIACLPIEKREILSGLGLLGLEEVIHLLMELLLINEAAKGNDAMLIGHSSQAIVATYRNITRNPMSAIVIPRLKDDADVVSYINRLERCNQ